MSETMYLQIPFTIIGIGGSRKVGKFIKELKLEPTKILIVTDRNVVEAGLINNMKSSLEEAGYRFDVFDGTKPNAPSSVVEKLSQIIRKGNYDFLIGVGGGSTMDTTKTVSVMAPNNATFQDIVDGKEMKKYLPKILVPTTAGTGSEWDEGAVVTDESIDLKRWNTVDHYLANGVIIDPEIALNLPSKVTAETGMDALCHAIEAYTRPKIEVIPEMFVEKSIKLVTENLRRAYTSDSQEVDARTNLAIAAALAMKGQMLSSYGIPHVIDSQVVRKVPSVTHGAAVSILLPYCMQYDLIALPEKYAKLAELMGEKVDGLSLLDAAQKSVDAVRRLSKDVGIPQGLKEVGITEADIPDMVDSVYKYRAEMLKSASVRDLTRNDLVQIFTAAL